MIARRDRPDDTPRTVIGALTLEDLDDFDPTDPAKIMSWDLLAEEYGTFPPVLKHWRFDWTGHPAGDSLPLRIISLSLAPESVARRYIGSDDELARDLNGLRNAVLLPIGDALMCHLQDALAMHEEEARRRIRDARRRDRHAGRYGPSDWERADLVAEVRAVAGEGERRGRVWWFSCPWHEDRTASLEVDPEKRLWHCFGCGAAGGVVDWRKRIEAAA